MPADEETFQLVAGDSPFSPEEEEQIIEGELKNLKPADRVGLFELTPKSGKIRVSLYTVLDKVFGACWDRAKKYEEKVRLINRFEEHYLRHGSRVQWYKKVAPTKEAIRDEAARERQHEHLTPEKDNAPLRRARRRLMCDKVLGIIDKYISDGKSPLQCLHGEKLKSISNDPWLKRLKEDYSEVNTFGDIANKWQDGHEVMFNRFKALYYRRKREIHK
jgi:hypothetical protein